MIFNTVHRKENTLHLTINNTIILRVVELVFYGFTINENWTWKDNINTRVGNRLITPDR